MKPSLRHNLGARRLRVRGFALTSTMLALVVASLLAWQAVRALERNLQSSLGHTEATILSAIRDRINALIFSNQITMQSGGPLVVNGISVAPAIESGVVTWRPTMDELLAMGVFPQGWGITTSSVNGAPYRVRITLNPAGCVGAACDISGEVWPDAPFLEQGPDVRLNGPVVQAILSDLGADAGLARPGNSAQITGVDMGWQAPNPVPGDPAGVVAVRVGTLSAALAPLVRIGDNRDPNLAGNLSVAGTTALAGNLNVAGNTDQAGNSRVGGTLDVIGPTNHQGQVILRNAPLALNDSSGNSCVSMTPAGVVTIACAGRLNADTGVFRDASGNTSTITPTGVTTGGTVTSQGGFFSSIASLFPAAEPDTIRVSAGDIFFRGPAGRLMQITSDGDVVAGKNLSAQRISLNGLVTPGDACAPTSSAAATGQEFAATTDGGFALCIAGRWSSMARTAAASATCSTNGAMATDSASGRGLICRDGIWTDVSQGMGRMALMDTVSVTDGAVLAKPACQGTSQPLIVLVPQNEGPLAIVTGGVNINIYGINRWAEDNGSSWVVRMRMTDGSAPEGSMLAHTYCWTPNI